MQTFKDKMYNYEVTPPPESWQIIATALDENKTNTSASSKRRNRIFYLSLSAAAAIIIFVFSLSFWRNNSSNKQSNDKITVPQSASSNGFSNNQNTALENANNVNSKKYITITSPQGECVQISAKAAKLIVASDDQNPPKPVWSAKVNKWKNKMENNVLAPTADNFLDIVELTHALKVDD